MDAVTWLWPGGWGSPVGLAIFMTGLGLFFAGFGHFLTSVGRVDQSKRQHADSIPSGGSARPAGSAE